MKKKIMISVVAAAVLIGSLGISGMAEADPIHKLAHLKEKEDTSVEPGEYVVSKVGNLSEVEENVSADEVMLVGEDILVTESEIDKAEEYYLAQNESDKKAKQDAVDYMTEFDAMYAEAVKNGYDVTESEVKKYVKKLQEDLKSAENYDEVKVIMSSYDSEQAYWDDMIRIYYKQLPIEKYVKDLESAFQKKCKYSVNTEEYNNAWDKEFQKIKDNAVASQAYSKSTTKKLDEFTEE